MIRYVRLVLAAALVALTSLIGVIAVAPAAQAIGTGWATVVSHVDVTAGSDFDCHANFRMVRGPGTALSIQLGSNGYCIGGPDTTPGYCQLGEVGCTTARYEVRGVGCGTVELTPTVGSHPSDSTLHRAFSLGSYIASAPTDCDPTDVQLWLMYTGVGNDSTHGSGQEPLDLDPPEVDEDGECDYAPDPSGAYSLTDDRTLYYGGSAYYDDVISNKVVAGSLSSGNWIMYAVYDNNSMLAETVSPGYALPYGHGGAASTVEGGSPGGSAPGTYTSWMQTETVTQYMLGNAGGSGITRLMPTDSRLSAKVDDEKPVRYSGTTAQNRVTPPGPDMNSATHRTLLGIGIFREQSWGSQAFNNNNGSSGWWRLPSSTTMSTSQGVMGVTNPARCAWYFGTKLWNNATLVQDEPAGTVTSTVPDPPDEEEPEPPIDDPEDDPDTDLGWLAAIWALLKWIGGLLQDLLSEIAGWVQGLLDGLVDLFVPEDGFLEDTFQDIKQAWRDSAPGAFVTGFSDMGVSMPGSSCGGIPVEFSTQGVDVDFNLGAACSGAAASAAATVKVVVSASLVLFGGIAAVRAIGSGFGWSPGVGKGGES